MTVSSEATLAVRQDRRLIRPTSHSKRFLLARIVAPRATSERPRPPVNLAIVLDRSGSMSGDKLRVAKLAVEEAIGRLQPEDRFSVVVYDDVVDVVIESTTASAESRPRRHRSARDDPGPRQHEPRRGLAARLRAGRRAPRRPSASTAACSSPTASRTSASPTSISCRTMPPSCVPVASRPRPSGSATTSTSGSSRSSPTPAAATSTTSPTRRRSATRSRPRSARRSRSSPATSTSSSPPATTSASNRSVRTASRARATARSSPLATSPRSRSSRSSYGCRSRTASSAARPGTIVALTDRDGTLAAGSRRRRSPGWPGRMPTTAPTTTSRATATSTGPSPGCSPRGRDRRPSAATGRATTPVPGGSSMPRASRIRGYAGDDPALRDLLDTMVREETVYAAPMAEPARKQAHFASANALRSRDAAGRSVRRG